MPKPRTIKPLEGGLWGIMGGTFNPVHMGHLIMAESVLHSYDADGMLFVPARKHPLKSDSEIATAYVDRLSMVRLAIAGNSKFHIEEPPEFSAYTIDLIDYLQNKYPAARFFLPIGSDLIDEFHKWHKHEEIEERVQVVIASRPGHQLVSRADGILRSAEHVVIPQYDIASRDIRRRLAGRMSIRYMVPETVREYIMDRGLYVEE